MEYGKNEIFPINADRNNGRDNMAIQLFGNRLYSEQTLYEYLIEFLLVFVSPKECNNLQNGKMVFHPLEVLNVEKVKYYVNPRIGLKRFIFFDRSKTEGKFPIDKWAYEKMLNAVKDNIDAGNDKNGLEAVYALQDLLYGYAATIKTRSWMAQSLLPIAPELIFPEAMPLKKERLKLSKIDDVIDDEQNIKKVDNTFDFHNHNFMARGGEVYYLHVLQGLRDHPHYRGSLEKMLGRLLTTEGRYFSNIACFLQDVWEKEIGYKADIKEYTLGYIPENAYKSRSKHTLEELEVFLSNQMHPITKIELLSQGIVLQILRMMNECAQKFISPGNLIPWIIDMRATKGKTAVSKLAVQSYERAEEVMLDAIAKQTSMYLESNDVEQGSKIEFQYIAAAKAHTLNLFKRLGKELQLIIPARGANERFSLSEDLTRFLVLSIIKPGRSCTFEDFLETLYEHFGIVIGPEQYRKSLASSGRGVEYVTNFVDNAAAFQGFMKNIGFVRDLSDATAIVVNPYKEEE